MKTYISILRGINVSGKNMIKMTALKELYEGLGLMNATTYIQSGNVIFQSEQTDAGQLGQQIMNGILERFELQVPVLIREYAELEAILLANPFVNRGGEDLAKLHITFLSDQPDELKVQSITKDAYLPDEFSIMGQTIYLSCPNGYGNTKLSNSFFENKLRTKGTTRNLRTLYELVRIGGLLENSVE